MLATLVLLAATAVASPRAGSGRYPVLLVHGWPTDFDLMAVRLIADGYRPYTVDLHPWGIDTVGNANRIRAKVDQIRATTGASKVHLVGHSMGGLSPRYYVKILGSLPHVATYTAFGTPQHGSPGHRCDRSEPVPDQCPTVRS